MRRALAMAGVMALTLGTMTAPAWGEEAAPPTEAAPAPTAAPGGTPLTPRPSRPLTLAPPSTGTPLGWKLLAGVGVAVAAGLWIRKRRAPRARSSSARVEVVGRTSVGMRSELIVVDVEGTRLLVGVTPSALQTLAVLDAPEPRVQAAADEAERELDESLAARSPLPRIVRSPEPLFRSVLDAETDAPPVELGERVRSLLAARRGGAAKEAPAPAPRSRKRASGNRMKTAQVAGQAKGLLLALEEQAERRAAGDEGGG